MEDEALAMARAVKRGRDALVEAVRRGLHGAGTAVPRASHAQVFECLDPDGTRLTVLAERARMSHQAMGEMVEELTRHGYLERVPDPADGRARLIRPTSRGRSELVRAGAELRRLHDRWQAELQDVTVGQVVAALQTLIAICEAGVQVMNRTPSSNPVRARTSISVVSSGSPITICFLLSFSST